MEINLSLVTDLLVLLKQYLSLKSCDGKPERKKLREELLEKVKKIEELNS